MKVKGFTLVEIMIVVAVLGLLSMLTAPSISRARERAQETICLRNRGVAEGMEMLFSFEQRRNTTRLEELAQFGYLKKLPSCPAGGIWSWASDDRELLKCSTHGLALPVSKSTKVTLVASDPFTSSSGWFRDDEDIYTFWRRQWVEYKFNFKEAGNYRLAVTAKNHPGHPGWTNVDGYKRFLVAVYVDGRRKGIMSIPASDDTYNTGNFSIQVPGNGCHRVKLKWLNDAYNPRRRQDANIRLKSISVEKEQQ